MKYLLLMMLLISCETERTADCTTTHTLGEKCIVSDELGEPDCGYKTMDDCLNALWEYDFIGSCAHKREITINCIEQNNILGSD